MTRDELATITGAIARVVREHMGTKGKADVIAHAIEVATDPLHRRIIVIEQHLKLAPPTWCPETRYEAGARVVHGGRVFHATANVKGIAPDDGTLWQPQ